MFVLDSNILIGLLQGDRDIERWIQEQKEQESGLFISIVTRIEMLSISEAMDSELEKIERFLGTFQELGLHDKVTLLAASIRRKKKMTLADAIILATTIQIGATLVTNDRVFVKQAKDFVSVIEIKI